MLLLPGVIGLDRPIIHEADPLHISRSDSEVVRAGQRFLMKPPWSLGLVVAHKYGNIARNPPKGDPASVTGTTSVERIIWGPATLRQICFRRDTVPTGSVAEKTRN